MRIFRRAAFALLLCLIWPQDVQAARTFNGTTSHIDATGAVTAAPLTISIWAYPTGTINSGTNITPMGIFENGAAASSGWYFAIQNSAWNFWCTDNDNWVTASGGTPTANTWTHLVGVAASSASRTLYVNGTSVGTNTTSRTPSLITYTLVGTYFAPSGIAGVWVGQLAQAAVWNVALTQNEITALSQGASPLHIRPGSLKYYAPLFGLGAGEPDWGPSHLSLTNNGATAGTMNPPVQFYPVIPYTQ